METNLNNLDYVQKAILLEALQNYLILRFGTPNISKKLLDNSTLVEDYVERCYKEQSEYFKRHKEASVRSEAIEALKLIAIIKGQ